MFGLVLLAQGIVAANACDVLRGNATQAFAVNTAEATEMHCHDEVAQNANACLAHCTQGDQVSVDQIVPVFIAPNAVVLVVDIPVFRTVALSSIAVSRAGFNTGPPVSVRFCTFQI